MTKYMECLHSCVVVFWCESKLCSPPLNYQKWGKVILESSGFRRCSRWM